MRTMSLRHAFAQVPNLIFTLFLFTKSDIKTTVLPVVSLPVVLIIASILFSLQTFFAVAASPRLDVYHVHHVVFWTWFHLLQFDASN